MKTGTPVSPGYASGKVFIYKKTDAIIDERTIDPGEIEEQLQAFENAKEAAKDQICELREKAKKLVDEDDAKVFDAHLMVLQDTCLHKKVNSWITENYRTADHAVKLSMNEICQSLLKVENALIMERVADVKDVCTRIIHILKDVGNKDIENLDEEVILVAEDLTPSDTIQMDLEKIKGIVTEVGGKTSHTAILARSLELPAITGVKNIFQVFENGQFILLNGSDGKIIFDPSDEEIATFEKVKKEYEDRKSELRKYIDLESITKDGKQIEIAANIGSAKEASMSLKYGPDGIGLFRTEFLFMDKAKMPTEEEQYVEYKKIAELMGDRPVIVRTLDIGGDKDLTYIDFGTENNPFLGWRAIRMCLDCEEIFLTQLKAILRACEHGKLRIMYPMVMKVEEIRDANNALKKAAGVLDEEGVSYCKEIETGIMIETPAAAVISDVLAKEVDFFSIGTNDLTQYTLAVDRGNEKIVDLYKSYHPAVLRLIKQICDNAHKAGIWVGMCGELAGDERMTKLLVGLGLDELSMSASSIPLIRKNVRNIDSKEAAKSIEKVLSLGSTDEILNYICMNL